jgi:ferredoxin
MAAGTAVSAGATRLRIDWTRCDGRGLCAELLPEILELDPWGYPVARAGVESDRRGIVVPRGLVDVAKQAVTACPLLALRQD